MRLKVLPLFKLFYLYLTTTYYRSRRRCKVHRTGTYKSHTPKTSDQSFASQERSERNSQAMKWFSVKSKGIKNDYNVYIMISLFALVFIYVVSFSSPKPVTKNEQPRKPSYDFQLCIMTKIRSLTQHYSCNFLEWIEYHMIMGVEHMIINDECSVDPVFSESLHFYKSIGYVTIANERSQIVRNCSNYVRNETTIMKETFDLHSGRCEWVSVIDADEYLSLVDDTPDPSLLHLLSPEHPFVRLPWFAIGSEGHEKRPQGLTIENYKHGRVHRNIKTIAKTSEVRLWDDAHHPIVKHRNQHIEHRNKTVQLHRFVESSDIRHDEHPRVTGANSTADSTANEIFLKHYVYLSWEEYSSQRAQYKVNANGRVNIWGINARPTWLLGANLTSMKDVKGDEFTQSMAVKVRAALKARMSGPNRAIFEQCASYWAIK